MIKLLAQRMNTRYLLVALAIIVAGCAPSTNFYPVRSFPRSAKPENAQIPIIPDPPGKPYQFLGVVTASGTQSEFVGNSASSTSEALFAKAREIGADALVHGNVESSSSYSVGYYGLTQNQQHYATAFAIAWALPSDSTFIPGDTTVQSIVETTEDNIAKQTGKVSMGMLRAFEVGVTTEREVTRLLGDPLASNEMEMTIYIKTDSWQVDVVDLIHGTKRVSATFQFNKEGKLSSKMIM